MAPLDIELRPVTHITTDAIGQPGQRVFYIQGWQYERVVSVIVEKVQIQSLAVGVEQFIQEVRQQYPDLPESSADYDETKMRIQPPVDPLFRGGEMGLGYDLARDCIIIEVREVVLEGADPGEAAMVRFWCSRKQARQLSAWAEVVIEGGRPLCPQCGAPMEPEGHFCPKKNGNKKK